MDSIVLFRWIFTLSVLYFTHGISHQRRFHMVKENDQPILLFDPEEITLVLNREGSFKIRSDRPLSKSVNVTFRFSKVIVELYKSSVVIPAGENGTSWTDVGLSAIAVGHDSILEANCTNVNESGPCVLNTDENNLRIGVVHSLPMITLIQVFGWIYFVAWSISFYPQIILNFRRKSVLGLNFDFLSLNATGFLFYSLYNCAMFWIPVVQDQYEEKYKDGVNPVQLNDVVFALHALFATLITIVQCFVFERGNQRVSRTCIVLLSVFWLTAIVSVIVVASKVTTWLIFFNILSGMKLAITLIKYVPQAYFNYRRKSTAGWSIGNILLDFTGGLTSLIQMFMLAYNNDDWKEIFGDFTKFGLGLISLLFDILFIFQHYIFYKHSVSYEPQDDSVSNGDEENTVDQNGAESIHVPYVDVAERRSGQM